MSADLSCSEQRSRNMASIRSRDTNPELYFRKLLFRHGYRYRIAQKGIPGRPDVFLRKYNTAVFVNGCYWHRHNGCKYATTPGTHVDFWRRKFEANVARDARVRDRLRMRGIKCFTVWECTLKNMVKDPDMEKNVVRRFSEFVLSDQLVCEI